MLLLVSFAAAAEDRQWINGRWFDGNNFVVARTVYTLGGRISFRAPAMN
jgi:hypothetical protein